MNHTRIFSTLFLALTVFSCSNIRELPRKDKTIYINFENSELLDGCNYESSRKSLFLFNILTDSHEKYDTSLYKYKVCLKPIDKKHLQVHLQTDSSITVSRIVKGHFRFGYFKIKRFETTFPAGPLLWTIANQSSYLGITKTNELLLTYKTGGSLMFFFFPFFPGPTREFNYVFQWTK